MTSMLHRSTRPDPYCAFKADRERRLALKDRHWRDVLIVLIVAVSAPAVPWSTMLMWARSLLR